MSARVYKALQVNVYRKEQTEEPGVSTTIKSVDERLLRNLAEKALRARSRRAVVGSGLVVATARNVRHEGGRS